MQRRLSLFLVLVTILGAFSCSKPSPETPPLPPPSTGPGNTDPGNTDPGNTDHGGTGSGSEDDQPGQGGGQELSYPVTPEDFHTSIEMTEDIAKAAKAIVENAMKLSPTGQADAAEVAKKLEALDNVLTAEPSENGMSVQVQQKNHVYVNVILDPHILAKAEQQYSSKFSVGINSGTKAQKPSLTVPGSSKKALLLSPYQGRRNLRLGDNRQVNIDYVRTNLREAGYSLNVLVDGQADLSRFHGDTLASYDYVIFRTHGQAGLITADGRIRTTGLATGERVDRENTDGFDGNIGLAIVDDAVIYVATVPWLETTTSKRFNNSIIHAGACETYVDDDMADFFLSNGASAYTGTEVSVDYRLDNQVLYSHINHLSQGVEYAHLSEIVGTDPEVLAVQDRLGADELGNRADAFRYSDSPDVFLFDPYPYGLKHKELDEDRVQLEWDMPASSGSYDFELSMNGKDVKMDGLKREGGHYSIITSLAGNGKYKWSVSAQLKSGSRTIEEFTNEDEFQIDRNAALKLERIVLDFGTVDKDSHIDSQTSRLTNSGNRKAVISEITCPPGFEARLDVEDNVVAAGQSADLIVDFVPEEEKEYSGIIYLKYSDDAEPLKCAVKGKAYVRKAAIVSSSAASLDFGEVTVFEKQTSRFTLTNTGNLDADVTKISCPDGFTSDVTKPFTLKKGESKEFTITFAPRVKKVYEGSISIETTAENGTVTVEVNGTGKEKNVGKLEYSTNSISFSTVYLGSTNKRQMTLKNTGAAALKIVSVRADDSDFTSDVAIGTVIPAGGTYKVNVIYTPTKTGSIKSKIRFSSDGDDLDTFVNLTATVKEADKASLACSPSVLDFGSLNAGQSSTLTTTIKNSGNAEATLGEVKAPSGYSVSLSSKRIPAGGTATMTVTFSPNAPGSYNGTITIASNSVSELSLAVNGQCNDPNGGGTGGAGVNLQLSSNEIDFRSIASGSKGTERVFVTSLGSKTVTITSAKTSNGYFSTDFTGPVTLRTDDKVEIPVSFYAVNEGDYNGYLTIYTDATDAIQVPLKAHVTKAEAPKVRWAQKELDFGEVSIGETKEILTSIANESTAWDCISEVTVPEGFSVNIEKGTELSGNSARFVQILFTPTSTGVKEGDIVFRTEASDEARILHVKGTGTKGTAGKGVLEFSYTDLNFGEINVGERWNWTVTATNTGSAPVTIQSISCTGGFTHDFSSSVRLEPGASTSFKIIIAVNEAKTYTGTITITSDASNGPHILTASATGKYPIKDGRLGFSCNNDNIIRLFAPSGTKTGYYLRISNSGSQTATIYSADITGSAFSCDYNGAISLKANQTKYITIYFDPKAQQSYTGTLTLMTDCSETPFVFALEGNTTGALNTQGEADITIDHGSIRLDRWDTENIYFQWDYYEENGFRVENTPSLYVAVFGTYDDELYWEDDEEQNIANKIVEIMPGKKGAFVESVFHPATETKDFNRRYILCTWVGNEYKGQKIVDVTGTTRGMLAVELKDMSQEDMIMDFGSINIGSKVSSSGYAYNYEANTVTISKIECPEGFTTTLRVGDRFVDIETSRNVTVYFQPAEAKDYSGDLKIYSDATNNPLIIHLKGQGK